MDEKHGYGILYEKKQTEFNNTLYSVKRYLNGSFGRVGEGVEYTQDLTPIIVTTRVQRYSSHRQHHRVYGGV